MSQRVRSNGVLSIMLAWLSCAGSTPAIAATCGEHASAIERDELKLPLEGVTKKELIDCLRIAARKTLISKPEEYPRSPGIPPAMKGADIQRESVSRGALAR